MDQDNIENLRYPIGRFQAKSSVSESDRKILIQQIADAPALLRSAVRGLNDNQLDTPYRPGGWTIRQVVHHVPDSHLNAYVRFKLAITEDEPTIKTYEEHLWAELSDAKSEAVDSSLILLDSLHKRWVTFLKSLTPQDFSRKFRHPERGLMNLDWLLDLYAWHGRHHTAHITSLRSRMGWTE